MAGNAAPLRGPAAPASHHSRRRVRFELAGPADEPELRRLLRESPMAGAIELSFQREPDWFAAAEVEGARHDAVVARDGTTGRLLGAGSRSVRRCFVEGRPVLLPYLGTLRLDPLARGRIALLRSGYALCRDLRGPEEAPFALTSILADNLPARRLLTAGVPGLPVYRHVEQLVTLVLAASTRPRRGIRGLAAVETAGERDVPALAAFLQRSYRASQFAPCWTEDDLRSARRTPNLSPGDFLMIRRDGSIAACLAVWDQRPFKQVVVRGYRPALERMRPALNLLAGIVGLPRLPRPGGRLEHAALSHVACEGDPELLVALVEAARVKAREKGCDAVTLGLSKRSPLLPALRRSFRHRAAESDLFLVHWEDGEAAVRALQDRVAHVEVATL